MGRALVLPTVLALAVALPARAASDAGKVSGPAPAKLPATTKIKDCCGYPLAAPGAFRLTFYWIASQQEHEMEPADMDIYDANGLYLGTFSKSFADDLKMEGTGVLLDGRILNWAGRCHHGAGACFMVMDPRAYPEGRGAGDRPLVPYRSIAVDPKTIQLGDAIYLPELDGVVLPDGTVHDGCVRADDVGLFIRRKHIDFFVGSADGYHAVAPQLAGAEVVTPEVAAPRCRYLVDPNPHTVY